MYPPRLYRFPRQASRRRALPAIEEFLAFVLRRDPSSRPSMGAVAARFKALCAALGVDARRHVEQGVWAGGGGGGGVPLTPVDSRLDDYSYLLCLSRLK